MKQFTVLVLVFSILYFGFLSKANHMPNCKRGFFKLPGMVECHPWLDCKHVTLLDRGPVIGVGSTKAVYLSTWKGFHVALSVLLAEQFRQDFLTGIEKLKSLCPSLYVVQLVGYCEEKNVLVTEYHRLGNATTVTSIMAQRYGWDSILPRLKLCLNYARILDYLHDGPAGKNVMCDSNDLNKLLSQLLVKENLSIVVNDVDALALIENNKKIVCGKREIFGDFVAPEQKWPYTGPFRLAAMPGYDEKTDIWKVPDVCKHFVSDKYPGADWIQYRLFNLHKSCKDRDPNARPTAKYLVSVYQKIIAEVASVKTEL